MVERNHHGEGRTEILLALGVDRNQSVILDILVGQPQDQRLTHHRTPIFGVVLLARTEPFELVVAVALDLRRQPARQQVGQVIDLELVADGTQRFERQHERRPRIDLRFGMTAVVAIAAVVLRILLAEIVQQRLAAAHRTLGIRDRLLQQQFADLLFGDRFALHELFEFLDILVTVKGQTVTLAAVAPGTTRLLIIPFERLGNVVMDDEPHVGLVDTHAESDRGDDHVGALHQEIVLIVRACLCIHTRMVGKRLDAVCDQQLRQLLDLLAAEAVDNAALARTLLDETYDVSVDVVLGAYLIEEVGPVERRLEYRSVGHTQILLYVHLHLRRRRRREGYERRLPDIVYDGTDTAVLGSEIMSPLRYAVRLVDGIERYLDLAQERDVILLGKRLGRKIEQFCLSGQHVAPHLVDRGLVERRIEEMRYARVG